MAFLVHKMAQIEAKGRSVNGDILEGMSFHMLEWQYDEHLSIKAVLKLPEKQFLVKRDDLVDFIEWKYHSVVKKP